MEKNRKLIDLTGAPFIVELREDGKWYIVGVKVRRREFIFDRDSRKVQTSMTRFQTSTLRMKT